MMPTAHAGASIVAAYVIEQCVFNSELAPVTLCVATAAGVLPDLDSLFALATKRRHVLNSKLRHHQFPTHTPLFYAALTAILWMLFSSRLGLLFGVMVAGHLILDSWGTDDGIMWLWPLSRRQFGFMPQRLHAGGAFGLRFYLRHIRCWRMVVPEILLLLAGALLAVRSLTTSLS
jgi:hypothetical protein